MNKASQKLVTLIDGQNKVLGNLDLLTAHAHPAQLHRAVSVWLMRNHKGKKQTLLQKRSKQKIVGGNQWGNTICGNVRPDETYLECATRRLQEEIGVNINKINLKPDYKFEYKIYSNQKYGEHELDQVYFAKYDGKFNLNPDETSTIKWFDLTELKKETKKHKIITSQETLKYKTNELKNLTPALKLKLSGETFEITPWTSLMLGDDRLWKMLDNF